MTSSDSSGDLRLPLKARIPWVAGGTRGVRLVVGVPLMALALVWLGAPTDLSARSVFHWGVLAVVPLALFFYSRHKSVLLRRDGSAVIPNDGPTTLTLRREDVAFMSTGPRGLHVFLDRQRKVLGVLRPERFEDAEEVERWVQRHYGRLPRVACDIASIERDLAWRNDWAIGSRPFLLVVLVLAIAIAAVLYFGLKQVDLL